MSSIKARIPVDLFSCSGFHSPRRKHHFRHWDEVPLTSGLLALDVNFQAESSRAFGAINSSRLDEILSRVHRPKFV